METEQPVQVPAKSTSGKDWNKILKTGLITAAVLAIGGGAGWYWRDNGAKDEANAKQAQINSLLAKVTKLEKDAADAKATTSSAASTTEAAQAKEPSADTLQSIKDSITSGNTAALEGYMASTVRVIIAASEGVGDRTPVQAIGDLNYIMNGGSWDFALGATTLGQYQAGDYKQYFPATALVGLSSKKYIVSFQFDASAKISGVFMANNSDLL